MFESMKKDARSGRKEWNGTLIERKMGLDDRDTEDMMTNLKGRDMAVQQQEGKQRKGEEKRRDNEQAAEL